MNNFIVGKTLINANVSMAINGSLTTTKDIYFNKNNISLTIQLATLKKQLDVLTVEHTKLLIKYNNMLSTFTTKSNLQQEQILKLNHIISNFTNINL